MDPNRSQAMTHQTNAQRLADLLELDPSQWGGVAKVAWPAASELRRLSAIEQARDVAVEMAAQYAAERDKLRAEVAHWKQNHAHEVARARLLKERTDMPVERIKAYELVAELRAQLAALPTQAEPQGGSVESGNNNVHHECFLSWGS